MNNVISSNSSRTHVKIGLNYMTLVNVYNNVLFPVSRSASQAHLT
ncbi:hypothetical protein DSUL_50031 [Desulfovibrionales bacterium]